MNRPPARARVGDREALPPAEWALGPLFGPTPRMKVAGGAISTRADQLAVDLVAGDPAGYPVGNVAQKGIEIEVDE